MHIPFRQGRTPYIPFLQIPIGLATEATTLMYLHNLPFIIHSFIPEDTGVIIHEHSYIT